MENDRSDIEIIKSYVSDSGKKVVISQMPDAYLLNAFAKYKKRMELLDKTGSNLNVATGSKIQTYVGLIRSIAWSLKLEIEKRGLTSL